MITVYFGRHYARAENDNVVITVTAVFIRGEVEIDGIKKTVKNLMIPLTSVAYIIEDDEGEGSTN